MRDIASLNALVNPLNHGEEMTINEEVWKVGQGTRGWYIHHNGDEKCHSDSQMDFIYNIVILAQ